MKFAHIQLPDFAVQLEILDNPSLLCMPVVIGGRPKDHGQVVACSPAARLAGVQVGMPLRQAGQLVSEAVFLPPEEDRDREAHRKLMGRLGAFSPLRQTVASGEVCIEASGLERLYGSDAQLVAQLCAEIQEGTGLLAKVGLASNRFVAATAAEQAELGQGLAVKKGAEADFLAPLEVEALPLSEEALKLLSRLGLLTVGQVARLPAGALSRMLGSEGDRLHRLARGIDRKPLVPEYEQLPLSARINLDWPLENLPALIAYADLLIGQLSEQLVGDGMAARNVIGSVEQEDGRARTTWGYLRPASSDRLRLLDRAAGLLEALQYTAGVTGLALSLSPLEPAHLGARQIPMSNGNALTADPLGHTLNTIRVRFGDGSIRDAAGLSGPAPEPVDVRLDEHGNPMAMVRDGSWTRIDRVQLHWRLEGDWWWRTPEDGNRFSRVVAEPPPAQEGIQAGGRRDYYQVVSRAQEILALLNIDGQWYLDRAAKPSQWPITNAA